MCIKNVKLCFSSVLYDKHYLSNRIMIQAIVMQRKCNEAAGTSRSLCSD